MKIDKTALRAVRFSLLALAASLLAGTAIVHYSSEMLRQEETRLGQLKTAQAMAQQKVLKSGDENSLITRYLADYRRLERQGFVGNESRINWLDALRTTNQELKLFGVEYVIEPQRAVALPSLPGQENPSAGQSTGGNGPQLRQTAMKLRLNLLHEGDLMRFFDHLAAQNVGLFTVEDCNLKRAGDIAQNSALLLPSRVQPYLQAECQLSWFTVAPAGAKP